MWCLIHSKTVKVSPPEISQSKHTGKLLITGRHIEVRNKYITDIKQCDDDSRMRGNV